MKIIYLTIIIALFYGCEYKRIEFEEIGDKQLSFKSDIVPVLEYNCTMCHNGKTTPLNLKSEVAYSQLMNGGFIIKNQAKSSPLITKIRDNHPQKGVPIESELNLLITWINQGALNN